MTQNIKHIANLIDSLADDMGNEMFWLPKETQTRIKLKLAEMMYTLAIKQFSPMDVKYMEMRKKSPNFLMRG